MPLGFITGHNLGRLGIDLGWPAMVVPQVAPCPGPRAVGPEGGAPSVAHLPSVAFWQARYGAALRIQVDGSWPGSRRWFRGQRLHAQAPKAAPARSRACFPSHSVTLSVVSESSGCHGVIRVPWHSSSVGGRCCVTSESTYSESRLLLVAGFEPVDSRSTSEVAQVAL